VVLVVLKPILLTPASDHEDVGGGLFAGKWRGMPDPYIEATGSALTSRGVLLREKKIRGWHRERMGGFLMQVTTHYYRDSSPSLSKQT
jgi:hypothetical protein